MVNATVNFLDIEHDDTSLRLGTLIYGPDAGGPFIEINGRNHSTTFVPTNAELDAVTDWLIARRDKIRRRSL